MVICKSSSSALLHLSLLTRCRSSYFCSNRRRNGRRGEIFLEEDETVAFIVKRPFHLQPAPKPRYKIDVKEREFAGEDEDTEVEGYQYDSDAYEKV